MRIPKQVRNIPWGEPYRTKGNQQLRIDLHWPVVDGERLLAADFRRNAKKVLPWQCKDAPDFRLVCSKKTGRAAVLYQGGKTGQRHDLHKAMYYWSASPVSCYPKLSPKDEAALGRWLGRKMTANHMMPELSLWVTTAMEAEARAERAEKGEFEDGDWSLCPEELPEGLEDYIRREVLPHDNVLIYRKGNVTGTCFRCGRTVRARSQRFTQNSVVRCPDCGAEVYCYLDSGERYQTKFVGEVVSIQRGKDGQSVWLRQWHMRRDSSAQWRDIPGHLEEVVRYGIRGCRVAKWQHEVHDGWYMQVYRSRLKEWTRVRSLTSIYEGGYWMHVPDDFKTIAAGTSLQYCDLQGYMRHQTYYSRNPIRFLLDWARYPALEKLWKAGYTQLVEEHIMGIRKDLRMAINWGSGRIEDAVKLPLRLLKLKAPCNWATVDLHRMQELYQMSRAGKLMEQEAVMLFWDGTEYSYIRDAFGHASVRRILRYLETAQANMAARNGANYERRSTVAQTYRDYLADCVKLKLDLDNRQVLFPADLYAAHQRTISQVKYQANKAMRDKFINAAEKLEGLCWRQGDLLIRPAQSPDELTREGAALHHCVGGYADRMAKGETAILFVRRKTEPDKPYYTMEYRDGVVIQCRTAHNASYQTDRPVKAFVDAWLAHIKTAKSKKKAAKPAA